MTELIEQTGFDLARFNKNHVDEWAVAGGDIWALPVMQSRYALMYNKEVFDVFGVDYPEDGMNWKEVIDLARRVSGEMNGVEYQGLYMPVEDAPIFWKAGNLVDPETDEPTWTKDEKVREYFNLYKEAYSIPGNPLIPEHGQDGSWRMLFEQGKLAMVAQYLAIPNPEFNIDWDLATYPEPEYGVPARGWGFGISRPSEHKEEILKVFEFWFSDEQILNNTFIRGPLYTPFQHLYENGSALEKAIEREAEIWEGKNVDALFALPVAKPPEKLSEYGDTTIIREALHQFVLDEQMDLNTLLREKYEEEVGRIKDEKGMY